MGPRPYLCRTGKLWATPSVTDWCSTWHQVTGTVVWGLLWTQDVFPVYPAEWLRDVMSWPRKSSIPYHGNWQKIKSNLVSLSCFLKDSYSWPRFLSVCLQAALGVIKSCVGNELVFQNKVPSYKSINSLVHFTEGHKHCKLSVRLFRIIKLNLLIGISFIPPLLCLNPRSRWRQLPKPHGRCSCRGKRTAAPLTGAPSAH